MKFFLGIFLSITLLMNSYSSHADIVSTTRKSLELLEPDIDSPESCPDGKSPKGNYCCGKDGEFFDYKGTKTYRKIQAGELHALSIIEACGCPDGGEQKGDECCKGSQFFDRYGGGTGTYRDARVGDQHLLGIFESCGCPDGGKLIGGYCCKGGKFLDVYGGGTGTYRNIDPRIDSGSFMIHMINTCGCPEGGEHIGSNCCKNGDFFDRYEGGTGTYREVDGAYAKECCKKGYKWIE